MKGEEDSTICRLKKYTRQKGIGGSKWRELRKTGGKEVRRCRWQTGVSPSQEGAQTYFM